METTPAQEAKREAAKQAVALLFMAISVVIVMAVQNPDFVKTWRMRLAAVSSKLLSNGARRAGHISMGTELRTGNQEYTVPYFLSLMRDKAKAAYDKLKEH